DLDQLVHVAAALRRLRGDLLKLLVERLEASRPVNVFVDQGKEKGQERSKINVQGFLPRAVEIRHPCPPARRRERQLGSPASYQKAETGRMGKPRAPGPAGP